MNLAEQLRLLGVGKKKAPARRKRPAGAEGSFAVIEERCPLCNCHGCVPLTGILDLDPEHVARAGKDDDLAAFRPEGVVFFDLETTGLSGGAGTVAFLVGTAHLEGDELVMRQYFLEDLGGEAAMLREVHEHLRGFSGLVSYNGKSFDLPILRTRFLLQGISDTFGASHYHLDLLHAARRFWSGELPSCRLKEVERGLLGISRIGDVDGWEIPGLYQHYLRTGDRELLAPVLEHNLLDVKSLVALTILAANHARGSEETRWETPPVSRPISRPRRARMSAAVPVIQVRERGGEGEGDPRYLALRQLSLILKKQGRLDEARQVWREMARDYPRDPFAPGELGMPGEAPPASGKKAAADRRGGKRKAARG